MMPAQSIIPTFPFPRLTYGTTSVTVDLPRSLVSLAPRDPAERHVNPTASGKREYLFTRLEDSVTVDLRCTPDTLQALRWFYRDWAAAGNQFQAWLNRFEGSGWLFANSLRDQNGLALTLNGGGTETYIDGPAIDGRGITLGAAQYLSVLTGQIAAATGYDDPISKDEGVLVIDCKPAFANNDATAHFFFHTLETGGVGRNRFAFYKHPDGHLAFEVDDNAAAIKTKSGTVAFSAGDRLRLVASWTAAGAIQAWAAVGTGAFTELTTAGGAGTGIVTTLGASLFIGSDHAGAQRAAGTYETVAIYKRAYTNPLVGADYRPVERNYYGTAELVTALWAPVRENLVQQEYRWQMTWRAGVAA